MRGALARAVLSSVLLALSARAARAPKADEEPRADGFKSLNMEAQAIMGELKLQSGDVNGARRTYKESLDIGLDAGGPKDEIAALDHYRTAEIALGRGEFSEARRHLEILIQRYPASDWASKSKDLLAGMPGVDADPGSKADAPYIPAMPATSPEEGLARLRAALEAKRVDEALGECYDFLRRYARSPIRTEVELAAGALHLRRGEPGRALVYLRPLATGRDAALRGKAAHLLGAALSALGRDEEVLRFVPAADASAVADKWLARAQTWRALADARDGRHEEAAERYRAISASGQDSPVRAYALAAIAADWDRRGKPDRARDALGRAAEEAAKWGLVELRESAALSEAHLLQRQRKLGEAAKAYAEFAKRFPQSPLRPQALYQRGLCLKRQDRTVEAADAFEELARRHPASAFAADAHLQLGQLYTESGRSDAALAHYRLMAKASEAKDADREALLLMAQVHYNKKRYRDAVPLYKRYLENAPDDARTREVERLLLTSAWQADADDPELPALLARYPDHPLAERVRWDIAARAYKRGDWAAAEPLMRRVAATRGTNAAEARFFVAECLRQQGRRDQAADAYRAFLTAAPKHARAKDANMRLGALLYESGDAAGAAKAYGRVGGDGAEAADASYNRALALGRTGDELSGAKAWESFATRFPRHPKASWAWWQAGRLREERSDIDAALVDYAKVTRGDERTKALYASGRILEKRKRTKDAKAVYEKLKGLTPKDDPSRVSGLLRLGLLYEVEEKPKAAAPLYGEALKYSEPGSASFETARKRLQALTRDKALLGK